MDTFKSTLNSLKKINLSQKSKSPDDGNSKKNNTLNVNHSQKNKKTKFEKLKTYVQNTFPTMSAKNVGLALVAIVILGKIGISRHEIMSFIEKNLSSGSTQKKVKKRKVKDFNIMLQNKINMNFDQGATNDAKFIQCIEHEKNRNLINRITEDSFKTVDDGNHKNPILFNIATICNTPTNLSAKERPNITKLRTHLIDLGFNREINIQNKASQEKIRIPEEQRFAFCMYNIMNIENWDWTLKGILFFHKSLQNGETQK